MQNKYSKPIKICAGVQIFLSFSLFITSLWWAYDIDILRAMVMFVLLIMIMALILWTRKLGSQYDFWYDRKFLKYMADSERFKEFDMVQMQDKRVVNVLTIFAFGFSAIAIVVFLITMKIFA